MILIYLVRFYETITKPYNMTGVSPEEVTGMRGLSPALKDLNTWGNERLQQSMLSILTEVTS